MILPGFPMPLAMVAGGFDPNTPPGTLVESQGGYYLGVFNGFHLFTPPKVVGENTSVQWKTANTATSGTQSNTDGWGNTNNMTPLINHPLANWVKSLVIYGLDDFYIPSRDEIQFMWDTRGVLPVGEAYTGSDHWSSTENPDNTSTAFVWRFGQGREDDSAKTGIRYARPLRRLEI